MRKPASTESSSEAKQDLKSVKQIEDHSHEVEKCGTVSDMKEGGKDIWQSEGISIKEEKQIKEKIKERQVSLEALGGQIGVLKLEKKKLEDEEQKLYDQIQDASITILKLQGSKNFEDIGLVEDLEEKKEKLWTHYRERGVEIKGLEAQIAEKEIEKKSLKEVGKDTSYHVLMPHESATDKLLEERVEDAKKKFETTVRELDQQQKTLEEEEEKLILYRGKYFKENKQTEINKIEKDIEKTEGNILALKNKIPQKEETIKKLADEFLDLKNTLDKIKQQ